MPFKTPLYSAHNLGLPKWNLEMNQGSALSHLGRRGRGKGRGEKEWEGGTASGKLALDNETWHKKGIKTEDMNCI